MTRSIRRFRSGSDRAGGRRAKGRRDSWLGCGAAQSSHQPHFDDFAACPRRTGRIANASASIRDSDLQGPGAMFPHGRATENFFTVRGGLAASSGSIEFPRRAEKPGAPARNACSKARMRERLRTGGCSTLRMAVGGSSHARSREQTLPR
jgi:hypothetical protein